MAQNNCTPQRIYGSYEQTLFMGLSVMSFSASVGWNGQPSEVTIQLVYDPDNCGQEKVYYDSLLNRQTMTGPDPGFTTPIIGSPHYFRVGDFEYMGLVQSYQQRDSEEGKNIYTVKLVDPTEILAGTRIITGDYAGGVQGLPNIINAYGYAESFGRKCPLTYINGSPFGSPANAFGGSRSNAEGMPWTIMQEAVSVLTSSIPRVTNQFSPYGRLVFRGSTINDSNYGGIKANEVDATMPVSFEGHAGFLAHYFIDLSSLPTPPAYYRVPGPDISLLDAITQLCDDAGCDFYVELLPVILGGQILKIIKVRVAIRDSQPSLTAIDQFIGDSTGLISTSKGRELRNETTSVLLVGEQQDNIYQATAEGMIEPFWGLDSDGNAILTEDGGNLGEYVTLDISSLNSMLHNPLSGTVVHLYIHEMKAALAGQDSFEAVTSYIKDHDNEVFGAYIDELMGAAGWSAPLSHASVLKVFDKFVGDVAAGKAAAGWVWDLNKEKASIKNKSNDTISEDLDTIYNFVSDYARNYLGRKYMVKLPYTCLVKDGETEIISATEQPTDSGWTDADSVIGLDSALTDFFSEENGKLRCFVKFSLSSEDESPFDMDELRNEAYLTSSSEDEGNNGTTTTNIFIGATAEPQIVFLDANKQYSPRAVITLNQPIYRRDDEANQYSPSALLIWFFLVGIEGKNPADVKSFISQSHGTELTYMGMVRDAVTPAAAAIPMHSNVLTYGPWYNAGPPGKSEFIKDTSFAPWEYGSSNAMNTAAIARVNAGITHMQVAEMGDLVVPGYPTINLGAELLTGAASVVETRNIFTSLASFPSIKKTYKGNWNAATNSPNITSGSGTEGDYYVVSVAGTTNIDNNNSWDENDLIIFSGGAWRKQSSAEHSFIGVDDEDNPIWRGLYGPNITSISCEVGSGGITTQYSMRTYTPIRSRFSRINAERLKLLGQRDLQMRRAMRLSVLGLNLALSGQSEQVREKIIKNLRSGKLGNPFSVKRGGTPAGVLTGLVVADGETNRKYADVGLNKISHLINECDEDAYPNKAMMSLDGLLRPVSKYGDGGLPRYYANYSATYYTPAPEPPVKAYTPPSIGLGHLDPLQSGHDVTLLAKGDELPEDGLMLPFNEDYADDYRFFALKGPIMLQQWGYDTDNKPIPNASDTENNASQGIFKPNTLKDSFMSDYLKKSDCWPVGPIDLRFDRVRGVWTIPPAYRLVTVRLTTNVPKNPGNPSEPAEGYIVDGRPLEDATGKALTGEEKEIDIYHLSYQKATAGETVVCYYDTSDRKYKIIECPSSDEKVRWGKVIGVIYNDGSQTADIAVVTPIRSANTTVDPDEGTTVEVKLPKRRWHYTDLQIGNVIAYVKVAATSDDPGSQETEIEEYTCVSDYSREVSIIPAIAYGDSNADNGYAPLPVNFSVPNWGLPPGMGGAYNGIAINYMQHPIHQGQKLLVYRSTPSINDLSNIFYVLRAEFFEHCFVSHIAIKTSSINQSIDFTVKDRKIYVEHKVHKAEEHEGLLYINVDVECCSSDGDYANVDLTFEMGPDIETCDTEETGGSSG
jgi:hypothetical protein